MPDPKALAFFIQTVQATFFFLKLAPAAHPPNPTFIQTLD